MARNRVIYQNEAVFVTSPSAASSTAALQRVQSCNYNVSIERKDINQFGELSAIDRLIIQPPAVTVDISYYFDPSCANETGMGLTIGGTHILDKFIADPAINQKSIYIETSSQGTDALGADLATGVIGIGNCGLTSWSLQASVDDCPTVSCAFEGLNMTFGASTTAIPFITGGGIAGGNFDPGLAPRYASSAVSAVRPGNITFALGGSSFGLLESDFKVQSATVAFTMSREPLKTLGNLYLFSREIVFPIKCTMSITAVIGDLATKKLNDLVLNGGDTTIYTCSLSLVGYPNSGAGEKSAVFTLNKAKLDSQNITSSIGANKSVTLELSAQFGASSGLVLSTPAV